MAGILAAYFALLIGLGGHSAWGRLGVPAMSPSFADLRGITSGWECTRKGIDVLPGNPCDPWKRPLNYPRIWMAPSFLGLGQGSTVVLGFSAVAIFLAAALVVLPGRARTLDAIVYGAALCSPAVMLGVERANVDILLFALLVLAVVLMRRGEHGPRWASVLVLFAAILKLFPIFAVGLLARQRRRAALLACGAVLGAFAVYALATIGDIRTIARVVLQPRDYAYGINILGGWLSGAVPGVSDHVWDVVLVAGAVAGAILVRRRLTGRLQADGANRDLDLFWVGASVYVCTFALFQSFDYRLVFLLLTVPQLLRWTRRGHTLAGVTLACVLVALWVPEAWIGLPAIGWALVHWNSLTALPPFGRSLPLDTAIHMILFAALTAALAATLPFWRLGSPGAEDEVAGDARILRAERVE